MSLQVPGNNVDLSIAVEYTVVIIVISQAILRACNLARWVTLGIMAQADAHHVQESLALGIVIATYILPSHNWSATANKEA